jgi:aminoglycoside phosphotransferase (APT) family kinase protein
VNYIDELKETIRKLHGVDATHVETVPITESHEGQTVWEGEVEVFDLADHPKASRVYAWAHETDDPERPRRTVTVLHVPPITSPRRAVQATIVQAFREAEANAEG